MDIPRARRAPAGVAWYIALFCCAACVAIVLFQQSKSHRTLARVEKATILVDIVKRGPFYLSVSSPGTLEPQNVGSISTLVGGQVTGVFVKPGMFVSPGQRLVQINNPTITGAIAAANSSVSVARAAYKIALEKAERDSLAQESAIEDLKAAFAEDKLQFQALTSLHGKGYVTDVAYGKAFIDLQRTTQELKLSKASLHVVEAEGEGSISQAKAQLTQALVSLASYEAQRDSLNVHAANAGVIESVDVTRGMSLAENASIAKVADINTLKVVLQVPEGRIQQMAIGDTATVNNGSNTYLGRVSRIAPLATNGTVSVDVLPINHLFEGRPQMNVEGNIQLARIKDCLSIQRPAGVTENNVVSMYVLNRNGDRALKVSATLGRASDSRIQILSGAVAGQAIVISDMSEYQGAPELELY